MAVLPWVTLLAFVASIISGYIHYNGKSISEISRLYPTVITPAGFAFSIWGLIYASVGIYSIWQLLPRAAQTPYPNAVSLWFLIGCICQTLWTPAFAFELFVVSAVLIWGIWLSLFVVNINLYRIRQGQQSVATSFWGSQLVSFPFAIWFGWITAASIINTTIVLRYSLGDEFFGTSLWGSLALTCAGSFAAVWGGVSFSWGYCLAIAWASFGIYSNTSETALQTIAISICGGLLAFSLVLAILALVSHRFAVKYHAASSLGLEEGTSTTEGQELHDLNNPPQRQTQFFFAQPVIFVPNSTQRN